jgi:hypothetical protein
MGLLPFVWYGGRSSFKSAIIYRKDAGNNVEIWLQDEGLDPILINQVPKRIILNWAYTGAGATSQILGYVRKPNGSRIDDLIEGFGSGGSAISRENYLVNYDGPVIGGQAPTLTHVGFLSQGDRFYAFLNGSESVSNQTVLVGLNQNSGIATVMVISISSYLVIGAAKTHDAVYVSGRHGLYADQSTPSIGDAYNSAFYWDNGALSVFSRVAGDTPSVNPADFNLLSYQNDPISPTLNIFDGVQYTFNGNRNNLINGGVVSDFLISVNGSPHTISIKGVESGAVEVLAVKIIST